MEGRPSNSRTRRRWAWAVRGASGLAVATAVSAATAADAPRAAVLLPPRVGGPATAPVVARGAADDNPLATTPVVRRTATTGTRPLVPPTRTAPAPDWLSGVDPNVIPAGANVPTKTASPFRLTGGVPAAAAPAAAAPKTPSPKLNAPPPLFAPGDPNPIAKGVESFKQATAPGGTPQPDPRSPGDPLQGTAANGAPVLAGPPAWRWYGYGSVTPGANPYAPNGQYPRGSANWHSVTRATPGAFPVPVVNPFRGGPGAEPPSYAGVSAPAARPSPIAPMPMDSATGFTPSRPTPVPTPAPVFAPPGGTKSNPVPSHPAAVMPPPVIPVPTLSPVPTATPVAAIPPALAPIPLPPPPSLVPTTAAKPPEPVAVQPLPIPTAEPRVTVAPPPVLPPLSVIPLTPPAPLPLSTAPAPVVSVPAVPTVAPVSAPAAASEDEVRWQSNPTHRPGPAPGTWLPPADRARPAGQPGASATPRQPIARGQIGDEVQPPADPVEPVVQAVCRGRATGIDVRHTGPRQVTVCFEARTQTDATALVRDLSARPELARYEINFCVLVK